MDGGSGSDGWPHLFRRESAKRNYTMAESHTRSASPDSLFVSEHDDHYTQSAHASQRRRLSPPRPALPRRIHHPGDGFDFRRPVLSSASTRQNTQEHDRPSLVIDLTDETDSQSHPAPPLPPTGVDQGADIATSSRATRGPRFGRNIIDVESEAEEQSHSTRSSARPQPRNNYEALFPAFSRRSQPLQPHPQYSVLRRPQRPTPPLTMADLDDVEFLDSRPASQARNRPAPRAPRSVTPYPPGHNEPIDLTGDDDDEVLHISTRTRPGLNLDRPAAVAATRTRSIADNFGIRIATLLSDTTHLRNRMHAYMAGEDADGGNARSNHAHEHRHAAPHAHAHVHVQFGGARIGQIDLGAMMDQPAFDLGYEGANRPPEPKYEPPKSAEKGFTRSPGEDEVVVCPNCGDELAMGDSDLKQQVWVIKKCGHAYCGLCTENRSKSAASRTNGKGKGKAPDMGPFKQCVVEGCKASTTSKTSMIHVYLGS